MYNKRNDHVCFTSLGIISGRRHVASQPGPICMNKSSRIAQQFISMRAEVIPLRLNQIGRQACWPVAIIESQCGAETGRGYAQLDRIGYHFSPGFLSAINSFPEEVVQQQVIQIRILVIGGFDVAQKHGPDDTSAAPHQRYSAIVEFPIEDFGGFA